MAGSWLPRRNDGPWGLDHLPYGVLASAGPCARIGDRALPLAALARRGHIDNEPWLNATDLNAFMAAGPAAWATVRAALIAALGPDGDEAIAGDLVGLDDVRLPFAVADYVGFYSSREHATNLGRIFRPGQPALGENWDQLPIGYHGRSGTVVLSGTPVRRPVGQRPSYGPSEELDYELEVGFVVGTPSEQGEPVPIAEAEEHLFGAVLLNDWSARDLQRWEYRPLGPFLGKSFATSVSPWVTPMAALERCRADGPEQEVLPYLRQGQPRGFDLRLRVELQSAAMRKSGIPPVLVAETSFAENLHWSPAQHIAHLTSNGASLRVGDLHASGTISGPGEAAVGSLIERSWGGARPFPLPDGTSRSFLHDGDTVIMSATTPSGTVALAPVQGTIASSSQ